MKSYKIFGDTRTSLRLNTRAEEVYSNSEYTIAEYDHVLHDRNGEPITRNGEEVHEKLYDIYGSDNLSKCNLICEGMTADEVNEMLEQQFLESQMDSLDYIVKENREEIRDLQQEAYKLSLLHPGCVYYVIANLETGEVYRTYSGEGRRLQDEEVLLAFYKDSSLSALEDYAWFDFKAGKEAVMNHMTEEQKTRFCEMLEEEDRRDDLDIMREDFPEAYAAYMEECADECVRNSAAEGDYDREVFESVKDWRNSLCF